MSKVYSFFGAGYFELEDTIFRRRGCISEGRSLFQLEEGAFLKEGVYFNWRRECIWAGHRRGFISAGGVGALK